MTTFDDLPVELIIEIINHLRPQSKDLPVIGVNAAWTNPDAFLDSLWLSDPAAVSPVSQVNGEGGDTAEASEGAVEDVPKIYVYSSLLALRA
jgi:hypothetical protein